MADWDPVENVTKWAAAGGGEIRGGANSAQPSIRPIRRHCVTSHCHSNVDMDASQTHMTEEEEEVGVDHTDINTDGIRQRQRQTHTQSQSQPDAAAAAPVTPSAAGAASASAAIATATGASLIHANQSRGATSSSAHICSNTGGCPLIAQWTALAAEERDALPLSEELLTCSQCRSVLYCSRDCQRHHWIEGGHKAACPTLAAKHTQRDGQTAAAAAAAAPGHSSGAAAPASAGAAPASAGAIAPGAAVAPHRAFNINLSIALGPRALIVFAMILYLIYRYRLLAPAPAVGAATPSVH